MSWLARDEREARIDDSADRLAYLVMSYGLLAIVAYRGFVERTASWELLALVVAGGGVGLIARLRHGVVSGRWLAAGVASLAIAALLGFGIAIFRA